MDKRKKSKEKILRVRPFNMANFSGGSGYMPMFAFFSAICAVPAAILLWTGMALPIKTENGQLDYAIIKRRMLRIVLPVCIAAYIFLVYISAQSVSSYSDNYWDYGLAILVSAVFLTFVPYLSVFFAARYLNADVSLTKKRFLLWTVIFSVALTILSVLVFLGCLALGDAIHYGPQ